MEVILLKAYEKPNMDIINLRPEEGLAYCGSHPGYSGGHGHGGRPGHGGGLGHGGGKRP